MCALSYSTGDLTGIILTSTRYPPGDYVLTITAIDKEEQTDTERVPLTILESMFDNIIHTSYQSFLYVKLVADFVLAIKPRYMSKHVIYAGISAHAY